MPELQLTGDPVADLDGFRSVADVTDHESLLKVRATKQAAKAAAKAAKAP